MAIGQSNGIFQSAEGGLDAPAPGVKRLQRVRREPFYFQIGKQYHGLSVRKTQTDAPDGESEKTLVFRFQEVEGYGARDVVIGLRDGDAPLLQLASGQPAQSQAEREVKLRLIGQLHPRNGGTTLIPQTDTTYLVGGNFASNGITVSEKIKKLLDNETETTNA